MKMQSTAVIVMLALTVFGQAGFCSAEHVIYVDGVNGHNNMSCLQSNMPCRSLEYVHHNLKSIANDSITIEICEPGVNLTGDLKFIDITNLSIKGEDNKIVTRIHCNTSYSGLSFVRVVGLSLSFLRLTTCGAKANSTAYDSHTATKAAIFTSALYILNCTDINISNSIIHSSNGTGISMYDTNGTVLIQNTDITDNFIRNYSTNTVFGGGGMHIEFTFCTPGTISNDCTHTEGRNYGSSYTIRNCTISGNVVHTTSEVTNASALWYNARIFDSGGGVFLVFASNASNNNITFYNCTMKANYAPGYGGGLKVEFLDSVQDNQVSIVLTRFLNNSASIEMGGGLQVSFKFYKLAIGDLTNLAKPKDNVVNCTCCEFKHNGANSGGGVNIFAAETPLHDMKSAVHFYNSTWTGNTALYGAAVHIMPGVWASETEGHYPLLNFSDCKFFSNKVIPEIMSISRGFQKQINSAGAFFCTLLNVIFHGETTFLKNNGTALYLSDSIARFDAFSVVVFDSNKGKFGGAIALVGRSSLNVFDFCKFTFVNNSAMRMGGAIYFKSTTYNVRQPCFIDRGINRNISSFNFSRNHAKSDRGHHIYVSSFFECEINCSQSVYKCIGNFSFQNPDMSGNSTATPPANFTLNGADPLQIFPGISFQLPITIRDVEGREISNPSYEASLENKASNTNIKVDSAFKFVSNNTIILLGAPQERATLLLDILSTNTSLLIDIVLAECPPGYTLKGDKCKCTLSYYGISKCDPEAYIQHGIWMGQCNSNSSSLCTTYCPYGYCMYNTSLQTPQLFSPIDMSLRGTDLNQFICSPTRNGTVCGKCLRGHSVYYNSWNFKCVSEKYCHFGILFYLLSTIVPVSVLFIVIIIFNINFSDGNVNGLILFAQIIVMYRVSVNNTIHFLPVVSQLANALFSLYHIYNLKFFNANALSFCLWKSATAMDILTVNFVTFFFAFALVFLTVFLLRSKKLANYFPRLFMRQYTLINGLSAFFTLCYSLISATCFQILYSTNLYDDKQNSYRKVVFFEGDLMPSHGKHIWYAALAVIFLIFIVILPPLLLIFYPLIFKILNFCNLSECKIAMCLSRIIPIQLLDSFQSPFKDNCRFFAGLYFIYRTIVLVTSTMIRNPSNLYPIIELELVLIIILHATIQPYKEKKHNIIDLFIFLNLAVINGITLYNYSQIVGGQNLHIYVSVTTTIQIVLMSLPLLCMMVMCIVKLVKKVKNYQWVRAAVTYAEIAPIAS